MNLRWPDICRSDASHAVVSPIISERSICVAVSTSQMYANAVSALSRTSTAQSAQSAGHPFSATSYLSAPNTLDSDFHFQLIHYHHDTHAHAAAHRRINTLISAKHLSCPRASAGTGVRCFLSKEDLPHIICSPVGGNTRCAVVYLIQPTNPESDSRPSRTRL